MDEGYLAQLLEAGALVLVEMDDMKFCDFESTNNSIGTRYLGSCHVVAVASTKGAFLAHISPRLPTAPPHLLHAGDQHVASSMDRFIQVIHAHRNHLGLDTSAWVVCAWYGGRSALPDQENIIRSKLQQAGLRNIKETKYYEIDTNTRIVGKGTVVVNRQNNSVNVYLEDRLVSQSGPSIQSSAASRVAIPSSSTSANTRASYLTPAATSASALTSSASQSSSTASVVTRAPSTTSQQATSSSSQRVFDTNAQRYRTLANGQWKWDDYVLVNGTWVYSPARR